MTPQFGDLITIENETFCLNSEPLNKYLKLRTDIPEFRSNCSACWRGYFAKWELAGDLLFLTDFRTAFVENIDLKLDDLFPGQTKVFASWFTGRIIIPKGEMLKYVHMPYASVFEENLIIEFVEGVAQKREVVSNRV